VQFTVAERRHARSQFNERGDMYEADISQATVLALFRLTENLDWLVPKFLH
jgi:hypothetical protein